MLCQDCNSNEATVHLTQIVNNEKMVISLCKECAAKKGFHSPLDNVPFPLSEILSGIIQQQYPPSKEKKMPNLTCPNCGLDFEGFIHNGRFGCGECYKTFRSRLEKIMRKIHGSSLHKGKLPSFGSDKTFPIKEEERLETELKKAIASEEFERAADLRDKLTALRDSKLETEKK
jgi:protein arginine kinase activator